MKNNKEKRSVIRVPIIAQEMTINGTNYTIDNFSKRGLFLLDQKMTFKIGDPLSIQIELPGDLGTLVVAGKVVHSIWTHKNPNKLGFGAKFLNVQPGTQKILDAYETYTRNKQIINVSKRIIEEFFGSSKNPIVY